MRIVTDRGIAFKTSAIAQVVHAAYDPLLIFLHRIRYEWPGSESCTSALVPLALRSLNDKHWSIRRLASA